MSPASPRLEAAIAGLASGLAAAPWGTPPAGFPRLGRLRPMRAVYAGTLPGAGEALEVVLKVERPVTALDRVRLALRGPRAAREAALLGRLRAAGLPVPEPLGHHAGPPSMLVTRRLAGLEPLPPAAQAPRALLVEVARMLARLHAVGLVHRDLTAANLGLHAGQLVLVDVGGARLARTPLPARATLAHLAQAAHGFLHGASRAQAARALRAWLEQAGLGRHAWRAWLRDVEAARLERRRLHHRRRERRIARAGLHFAALELPGLHGVRRVPDVPDCWLPLLPGWAAQGPAGAEELKGTRVLGFVAPDGTPLVLKRYAAVAPGRRPRALGAFRRAVQLEERGLRVTRALACIAQPGGPSLLLGVRSAAADLDHVVRRAGTWAQQAPAQQRALLVALGRSLRRLHDAEVAHRDLKAPNLLVQPAGTGWDVVVADVDGARPLYAPVAWARRARDLARLAASLPLPRSQRLRVLAAYAAAGATPPISLRALARQVHRHAQAHRRRLARQGRPHG
ncbi:MAG: lipopolysaccharide kinase InaA family protein, partial [Planctomycetia bacterium]